MIKNRTKNTTVSKDFKKLKSLYGKTKGLIGEKDIKTVVFQTRFGIHTFGVKSPIDILILNKKLKVAKLKKGLKPNLIFIWNPKYDIVIELQEDSIEKSKTEIGDHLDFNL